MPYDNSNVFARILRGELPCYRVFEDANVLAFLDAFPVANGHTLVIPKLTGYSDLSELPEEAAAQLAAVLPRLCRAVKAATGSDAVNIIQNVGAASGQAVFHPHFHIVPRKEGDGLIKFPASRSSMLGAEEAKPVAEAISGALSKI